MTANEFTASEREPLPAGWRWARLGDVCEFLDSRRIPINDAERTARIAGKKQSELFPYYGANGQVGWIDGYLFDEPLILLAEDGGNFGSVDKPIAYSVSGRYWVNNHAHVLKPRPEIIDFDYCLHALRIRPDVGDLVSGSTRAKLNQEIATTIPIPLPPLPEQRRIAARLNAMMAEIARARAAAQATLDAANALPAALLRAVFESDEAKGWEMHKLGEVCETPQYGYTAPATRENTGTKILRITDIQDGRVDWQSVPYCEISQTEIAKYLLTKGDILFARTGATTGKSFLITDAPTAVFASYLIRVRPHANLLPNYLYNFLQSDKYWEQVEAGKRGGAQPNMNATLLAEVSLPVPPLETQKRIVAQVAEQIENSRQVRAAAQSQLDAINALPAAYLRKAFRGEL